MSLTLGAVADNWGGQPPPRPPPGSVCGVGPEWYKKHEQLQRRLPSDPESFPAPVIVGNEKRSLGVTNLPRLWARGLLSSMGEPCYGLKCACVEPHRTSPYGFFKKGSQCPLQHGADFSCNTAEDGFSCNFGCGYDKLAAESFSDEECDANFPGTRGLCIRARW